MFLAPQYCNRSCRMSTCRGQRPELRWMSSGQERQRRRAGLQQLLALQVAPPARAADRRQVRGAVLGKPRDVSVGQVPGSSAS